MPLLLLLADLNNLNIDTIIVFATKHPVYLHSDGLNKHLIRRAELFHITLHLVSNRTCQYFNLSTSSCDIYLHLDALLHLIIDLLQGRKL